MFLKFMLHQGTDEGSRQTPKLIPVSSIVEIRDYHGTISKHRLHGPRWAEIEMINGKIIVVDSEVQDIEFALQYDEAGNPRELVNQVNYVIDVTKSASNRRR